NCLAQDEAGFIWMGTWKGLYRYDGYEVINFSTINPQFAALKIEDLLIEGNYLWVGSFVTGLYRIDLTSYQITNYHSLADVDHQISDNNVIALCKMPGGFMLAGTERGGFYKIDSLGNIIRSYSPATHPEGLHSTQVSEIVPVNENTVLLGSNALIYFNLENETFTPLSHELFDVHIAELASVSENEFMVSTLNGLYYLNTAAGIKVEKILNYRIKSMLKSNHYNERKFLIGTFEDLFEYNVDSKQLTSYSATAENRALKLNINSLLYTHHNVLMIGSESGLYSLVERQQHFNKLSTAGGADNPDIISMIDFSGTNLFAGSWGKGMLKLNQRSGNLEPVSFSGNNIPMPRFIFTLKKIEDTYWFSDKNNLGIFAFDEGNEPYRLRYYPNFVGLNQQSEMNTVTSILSLKDHTLIVGTWEGKLYTYDKQNDRFMILTDQNQMLPQSQGLPIYSLIEDKQGSIWASLSGGGLLKMQIHNKSIVLQQHITVDDGLVSNFVTCIYQSKNNKIWIGTEAGLTVIDEQFNFTSRYNKDIIFDIQSIHEDPIGFLWIGTQKGLIRINSNHLDEPFKLFDRSDGLNNHSFYLNSIFAKPDYTFYFGGYNGIDYFTPYKIEYNYNKPSPKITNFLLFNERTYVCSDSTQQILQQNITGTKHIRLKHHQHTFTLEFSNLEYQMQEKCQFAYLLEGVDKDWNYKDANHRYAIYTKLSPGTYNFFLKSTNYDGVWCDEPVSLSITISPPFWSSTIAYIIYFVSAMLLIFLITYYKIIKVQDMHKQQMKELEFTKQKELDELKLRFFTNISHEFRTPLTLILGPLAKILENDKNNPYKEKHLMIFRNANRLLHLTNRIMDFRKSENEQLKLKVESTNISDFIYNIFLFFNYEAQKRNIDYRFKTSFDNYAPIDQEFVESITFNLLSNAFKYTPDGKSITVMVSGNEKEVILTVADTGTGIQADQLEQIFYRYYPTNNRNSTGIGLSFTKRLVELHKGTISVQSEWEKGSTFTVSFPANDVYQAHEKITTQGKERIVDWRKIDQSLHDEVTREIGKLKDLYEKDEMIVLVVDDNFEVRQFITSLLENDFTILEASNGKEGLEKAFRNIPDMIISDIMMPEMDGLEMCRILKSDQRTDHIPVILTTVLSSQNDRIEGLSQGADSYIPKPIDPNHLLVRVNKLIEKQLKLKEKFNISKLDQITETAAEPAEVQHPLVEKAHKIVLQNLDNSEYNIDDFCNDLGLSRMQLYRKFKAITGLSANSFIRKVRLHKAAEMLKSGNCTVKEVTYDVGFIDLKYFRKCFHEEFGVNPSEYAQRDEHEEEG
ncbi:MAG: response regulator, partial [Prolixibacteraceae bacterium]|nr:response regulator [Prolixibacteraceae bacterium]